MHMDLGWNSIGETQIVGGRHPIDKDAYLIPACDGINDFAGICGAVFLGQTIDRRLIVEATIHPAQSPCPRQSLQYLVHSISFAEIQEIPRRPHATRRAVCDPCQDIAL